MANEIEELIIKASSSDDGSIAKLTELAGTQGVSSLREEASNFDFLFDKWNEEEETTENRVRLIFALAEHDVFDSAAFRDQMNEAVRFSLPPYIASQGVQKAVGARDSSVQPHEVVFRLKKLQRIRNGALMCVPAGRSWRRIVSIERFTAGLSVTSLRSGSLDSVPLSNVFSGTYFFESHKDLLDLLNPSASTLRSSAVYRRVFSAHALNELSENRLREIITSVVVPDCLNAEQFEIWWSAAAAVQPAEQVRKREVWNARSVLELYTLLNPEGGKGTDKKSEKGAKLPDGVELNAEQSEKLKNLFERFHGGMDSKTEAMLAESIAILAFKNSGDTLGSMFAPLKGKVPFWPADVNDLVIAAELETWGHVPMKMLPSFIKATGCLYTQEEMAMFGCVLPLRSLTVFFDSLPIEKIASAIFSAKELSSDILLYLWKNRGKCPKNLTQIVDMDHIAKALTREHLPKEWASAQRDIKRTLFEKDDFQKFVLENADGDMPSIIDALQKVRTFQFGECQSLLVKLSKHSEDLKKLLENGEGNSLFRKKDKGSSNVSDSLLSSVHSVSGLAKELDNIINVQIPENVAAIKHARSYGDLSENAEYDAAKAEKRNLHSRRAKLESILSTVQVANFSMIEVKDFAVMGSTVTLESAAGKEIIYHIVGAFDGNPDAMMISYKTAIGEAIVGHKVGESVVFPDRSSYIIKKIAPLPADMIALFGTEL